MLLFGVFAGRQGKQPLRHFDTEQIRLENQRPKCVHMLQAKNLETDNYSCSLPFTRIRSADGIGSGNYENLPSPVLSRTANGINEGRATTVTAAAARISSITSMSASPPFTHFFDGSFYWVN